MKIVAYSDVHSHEYKNHSWVTETGLNSRVEDIIQAVSCIYEYADKIKAPRIFAGDMFQIKGQIPVTGFNELYRLITGHSAGRKMQDIMLPGNHDMATPDGRRHALEVFANGGNVVIGHPSVFSPWPGVVVGAIPYPMEDGKFSARKFVEAYNFLAENCSGPEYKGFTKVLVSHLYTHELMGKYHGVAGDINGKDLLESFDVALLGHHHIHDVIEGDRGKKCVSIGAPVQHTFNDVGDRRGFIVLNTETLEVEHHEIESRKFWSFTGKDSIVPEKASGSFVRVRVGSKAEGEKARKELEKAGAVSIVVEVVPETKKARLDLDLESSGGKDEEIVQKFLDSEYCTTDLDKAELKTLANRYLSKAA